MPGALSRSSRRMVFLRVAQLIREDGRVPIHFARDGVRVRIDQQLGGIEAQALVRVVRPVHAVAVKLPRLYRRQIAMPDVRGPLAQFDLLSFRSRPGR